MQIKVFIFLHILALCSLVYHGQALAKLEQTRFTKSLQRDGSMEFSYKWRLNDESYAIKFSLSSEQLLSLPITARRFSNQMINREVEVALKKHAVTLSQRGVRATVRKLPQQISFSVSAPNQQLANEAIKELEEISSIEKDKYLERHYVVNFIDHLNREFVQNDYRKYATESIGGLQPIVDAIKSLQQNPNDRREFALLAMTWLQSIPYNDLLSRSSSNGAGYLSPVDLMRRNIGDCDSKSTLLAALLKAYNRNMRVHMVLLPEHALLAVNLSPKNDEQTLEIEGKEMLLIEPTGPAHYALGKVDDKTALAILNRQYKTLAF